MKTKKENCPGNSEPYSYHCDRYFYDRINSGRNYGWKYQLKRAEE